MKNNKVWIIETDRGSTWEPICSWCFDTQKEANSFLMSYFSTHPTAFTKHLKSPKWKYRVTLYEARQKD